MWQDIKVLKCEEALCGLEQRIDAWRGVKVRKRDRGEKCFICLGIDMVIYITMM